MSFTRLEADALYKNLWSKMERDFDELDADTAQQFLINVENWAGIHNSPAILAVAQAIYESLHVVTDDEAFEEELRRVSLQAILGARAAARREQESYNIEEAASVYERKAQSLGGSYEDMLTAERLRRAYERVGEENWR